MRGDGLESQLSYSTLNSILQDDLEPNWVKGDYDTGTQKAVSSIADRLCRIYGVSLNDNTDGAPAGSYDRGNADLVKWILILFAVILVFAMITNLMRPGGGWGAPRRRRRGPVFFVAPPRRPRRPPPPPPPRFTARWNLSSAGWATPAVNTATPAIISATAPSTSWPGIAAPPWSAPAFTP